MGLVVSEYTFILADKNAFSEFARMGRISKSMNGKRYDVVRGKHKDTEKWEDQMVLYPSETWTESESKQHNQGHKIIERKDMQTRAVFDGVTVRAKNANERTATFVAATEGGVRTFSGPEHLRISGVDLKRFERNPVILDTHNRGDALSIIGKAERITQEGSELVVDVRFAKHERAEAIWQMVDDGFINALSVGFMPRIRKEIREGAIEKLGSQDIKGPASIVEEWELLEISVVPVPADPDALKREIENCLSPETARELIGKLSSYIERNDGMEDEKKEALEEEKDEEQLEETPETPETDEESKDEEAVEEKSFDECGCKRDIYAIAPHGFEHIADQCIIEGKTVEEARTIFLAESAKRAKPVGTPEPKESVKEEKKETRVADVDDATLVRGLCG